MGRIIIIGDSLVYGKWDTYGGWAHRLRMDIDSTYNIGKSGNHQVYVLGIPGETTRRLKEYMSLELEKRINPEEKNIVILQVGVNDVNRANMLHHEQTPKDDFIQNYEQLIQQVKQFSDTYIIVGLLPIIEEKLKTYWPSFVGEFSALEVEEYKNILKAFCNQHSYPYIDIYSLLEDNMLIDGIHPNSKGHHILYQQIKKQLEHTGYLPF